MSPVKREVTVDWILQAERHDPVWGFVNTVMSFRVRWWQRNVWHSSEII